LLLTDHDTAGLYEGDDLVTLLQLEVIYGIDRDGGGDSIPAADIDLHFCRDSTFLDLDDLTLDLISCAELHVVPPSR
jgi:hypothetical protein